MIDSPSRSVTAQGTEEIKADVTTSDEDLVALATSWMKEADTLHDHLERVQKENEDYYKGKQTKKDMIPGHQSDAVDNRIFTSIETICPIITANPPQWMAMPGQETENSMTIANATQKMLQTQYDVRNVKDKLRDGIRNMLVYRLGIWKVFWDEEVGDVNLKVIRPQRIWVSPFGNTVDELPYIIEKIDMTFDEIEDVFGKKVLDEISKAPQAVEDENNEIEKVRTIWEVWTDDIVFWKYGGKILKKLPNPYWDWEGTQGADIDELKFYNHFSKPRKPYIIRSPFTLGNSIIGDTDLIQQAIPMQDIINTNLRQITNNANKIGNPRLLIDNQAMTKEEAAMITNAPGQILMGDGVADPSKFRYEDVPSLPPYIFANMQNGMAEIDNIMGTHSTTRGEQGSSETLGGRILLKQQDFGRIGDIVGLLESAVTEIGNWFVQMFKLYYDTTKTIKLYGQDGIEFVTLSRDEIEDGLEIIIKAGSTLPTDEVSRRNEALELWQMGVLDPITLFERMKFPNPEETAQRLIAWQTGQLVPGQPLPGEQAEQPGGSGGVRQPGVGTLGTSAQSTRKSVDSQGQQTRKSGA